MGRFSADTAGTAPCPGIWPTRKGGSGKALRAIKLMVTMVGNSEDEQGRDFLVACPRADQPRGSVLVESLPILFQVTLWTSPQGSPGLTLHIQGPGATFLQDKSGGWYLSIYANSSLKRTLDSEPESGPWLCGPFSGGLWLYHFPVWTIANSVPHL